MSAEVKSHTLSSLTVGSTESLKVQVSAEAVATFATLSGDCSPLHVDAGFAVSRGFSGCVAHGMLIGAYVSALVGTQLPGRHGVMQSCELQFRAPLVPPDTLTITGEVINISASTGQLTLRITVKNVAGRLLATAQVKSILRAEGRA